MLAGWLSLAAAVAAAPEDGSWHESFEGPAVSWRPAGADMQYRLEQHGLARGGAHTGQSSEQLRVSGSTGSAIYFSHAVPKSRVTAELAPTVWIKADRPGIQILARIVLPNLIDPKTHQPTAVFIRGTTYAQTGRWEQLHIDNLPRELQHQLWVLNRQYAREVDARAAYLDEIWLNVYAGPGATNVAIDDLDLTGIVPPAAVDAELAPGGPGSIGPSGAGNTGAGNTGAIASQPSDGPRGPGLNWKPPATAAAHEAKLDGSVLLVDGRPFFPRILHYQGEPLDAVVKAGFNAIRVTQPPSAALLADAKRVGLWIICPPPVSQVIGPAGPKADVPGIGPEYDSVLAWHLGEGLTAQELSSVSDICRQLQSADVRRRPTLCGPESDLRAYSRHVDVLTLGRAPLGTSIELHDYLSWLRERPRLARPGTTFWTTVETHVAAAAAEQVALFSGRAEPIAADSESIRLLTYTALAAGARGIEFQLGVPLDKSPPILQTELTLLNMELELAEPWTASGSFVAAAESKDPQVLGAVLQAQTARLLLPMRLAGGSQFLPRPGAAGPATIVVPGVPESHLAYELTPGGLLPLRPERVTGGTKITLDELQLSSMVLITADLAVVSTLSRRMTQLAERAAPLERELAAQTLAEVEGVEARLPRRPQESGLPADWLAKGRASLAAADKALAAGDRAAAYQAARKAIGPLEQLKRYRWELSVTNQNSIVTSPCTVTYGTLPDQGRLLERLHYLQPADNQLPGGDCENLDRMVGQNWRHVEHPLADIATVVELSTAQPHGGRYSLHLQVKPGSPDATPGLVETAPVWVTTAPVMVQAQQLIALRGFVRVPKPITGSIDGLLIMDSIGGPALGERVGETNGWREFVMYRIAPRAGPVSLTFALSGLGDAFIDDVSLAPVTRLAGSELGRSEPYPAPASGQPVRR